MESLFEQLAALLGLGGGGAGGYAVWQTRANSKRIDQTRDELSGYKTHVAENYAKSEDVKSLGDRLEKHLTRIEDKLDRKVDK